MPPFPLAAPVDQAAPAAAPTGEAQLRAALAAAEARVAALEEQLAAAHTRAELREAQLTAHCSSEQQLAEQRAFYEAVLEHLPMTLAVIDKEFRYVFANQLGVPDSVARQQYRGQTVQELSELLKRPADVVARRQRYLEQAAAERRAVQWEETVGQGDTRRSMLVSIAPIMDASHQPQYFIMTGFDITARYQAEEQQRRVEAQLRAQQQFIRLIVDALPNVVYVITAEGKVKFHNAAFNTLAAQSQHMLPPTEQDAAVQEQLAKIASWRNWVLHTGQFLDAELALLLASGGICHLQVHMCPLPQPEGGFDVLVVSTDITDLKEARQAAEANSQAKEAFLARMSHEIRTPLNGMLGMVQLLRKMPLTPVQQEYLLIMQRSGRHLLALINDVLDLAKITAHHLALDAEPFGLAALLQGAGEIVAPLAGQKGLELTIEPMPAPDLPLLGDAYRLQQILLNLLSNAIKFTERGSVRLGVALLASPPEAQRLRFRVQDTGPGIAPEQQERIFESFAQASSDTSAQFGGTGLGLAITEQLVQQMGGRLLLCSQPGEGSSFGFVLSLPVAHAALPAAPPKAPAHYEGLRGLRVLLAEDNLVNQLIARAMLEYWGVEVHTVGTGTEALEQLTTQDFDAAVLDINMPGLNGVQVATGLRRHAHAGRAATPLVALTANAFASDRATYLAAGMNGCVTKPFEEAELCGWLLRLTRRGAATA